MADVLVPLRDPSGGRSLGRMKALLGDRSRPPMSDSTGTVMADRKPLRITSVMGVARALLATLDREETVEVLMAEFGWDAAFQALSLLQGPEAEQAFALVWERLVTDAISDELRAVSWRTHSPSAD